MKRIFLLFVIILVHNFPAQGLSKDPYFANAGIYTVFSSVPAVNDVYGSQMILNSDGSLYVTSTEGSAATGYIQTSLTKLTALGLIDQSFGVNGKVLVNSYMNPDSQIKKQSDGKILIMGFHHGSGSDINTYADIYRFLPNGQADSAFGNNGVVTVANMSSDYDHLHYGLMQQNSKILFFGEELSGVSYTGQRKLYRLNSDGSFDTTFGTGGHVNTQGNFIFADSQSNIIMFKGSANGGLVEKYNADGQPVTSYGNGGSVNINLSFGSVSAVMMDSNSNIVCANMDGELFRIFPDASIDASFTFNSASFQSPFLVFKIVEKSGFYYLGGESMANNRYFITRLTQTGIADPVFGYHSDNNPLLTSVSDLIIDNQIIYAGGGGYLAKYIANVNTLSTEINNQQQTRFYLRNPVRNELFFKTDLVKKTEIYNSVGQFVKSMKNDEGNISDLPNGYYIVKIFFYDGHLFTSKIIKE